MALAKIDKTKTVVSDSVAYGAFGYKDLNILKKGINLAVVVQNGYKLGKITDSSVTGYVKVQLLNEIYGPNAEDTYTVLYFKRNELSYETTYTKTVKTSTPTSPAVLDLKKYWVKVSSGVLNIREKPLASSKSLLKLTNNQLVGKSDGVGIMDGVTEFYRFVNSEGAVYYVASQYLVKQKPSETKVSTTNKNDKPLEITPMIEPDIKPKEAVDSPENVSDKNTEKAFYVIVILLLLGIAYFVLKPKKPTTNATNGATK